MHTQGWSIVTPFRVDTECQAPNAEFFYSSFGASDGQTSPPFGEWSAHAEIARADHSPNEETIIFCYPDIDIDRPN